LQPLKWEKWQRVRSRSLALQKTNNEPENKKPKNQETRKPRNPKTKKPKKQKAKKNKIAHPKGGVVAESWVLSFCFFVFFLFFLILVFFSHYRKTKQKLSMVSE
jgi:ATP-dependent Zn protease